MKVLQNRDGAFQDVEVMAPDFDCEYIWLWNESDASNRLDLGREQMRQLRDALDELLGK